MSYTYTEQKGDGTARTFPFSFAGEDKGYIRATDIVVETAATGQDYQQTSGWTLSGTNQITFLVAPTSGLNIRIRRVVDKNKPFAKFDRSVTLDMLSLNNTFVQTLQVIQEIMDGFFPANFFFKGNINLGGHRIVNMSPAVDEMDAVNKGQLDAVIKKNEAQDAELISLRQYLTAGTSSNNIPWYYDATGGETSLTPPYSFDGCLVFIDGVLRMEQSGEYHVNGSTIVLSEPLPAGVKVLALLGSRIAVPVTGDEKEVSFDVVAGATSVTLPESAGRVEAFLDGLYQPIKDVQVINLKQVQFSEPLPQCTVTVKYHPAA